MQHVDGNSWLSARSLLQSLNRSSIDGNITLVNVRPSLLRDGGKEGPGWEGQRKETELVAHAHTDTRMCWRASLPGISRTGTARKTGRVLKMSGFCEWSVSQPLVYSDVTMVNTWRCTLITLHRQETPCLTLTLTLYQPSGCLPGSLQSCQCEEEPSFTAWILWWCRVWNQVTRWSWSISFVCNIENVEFSGLRKHSVCDLCLLLTHSAQNLKLSPANIISQVQ